MMRPPRTRPSTGNRYQPLVAALCRSEGWPEPLAEQRLVPGRRFSCDLVWPVQRLVVEVQGGIWNARGGHTGGVGQRDDMEKLNLLQLEGWRVLQVTPDWVQKGQLRDLLRRVFANRRPGDSDDDTTREGHPTRAGRGRRPPRERRGRGE